MKRYISLFLAVSLLGILCACAAQKGGERMEAARLEPFALENEQTPAAEPADPAEMSSDAAIMPSEPAVTPTDSAAAPPNPAAAPSDSAAMPSNPAAAPSDPTAAPSNPTGTPEVPAADPFLPADTVRTLWETFGLEKTAREAFLEAQKSGDFVITRNSDIIAGRDRLLAYRDATGRGETGEILVFSYYDLEGVRCGVEYFREHGSDRSTAYLTRLNYDGQRYTYESRESDKAEAGEFDRGSYPYLLHLEGETRPLARPYRYEHFVLVNDDTLTWERIEWGLLSSQYGDSVPHFTVASRLYKDPAGLPQTSYVPSQEERMMWHYRLNGTETQNTRFMTTHLDSEDARRIFAPAADSQGMLSFWQGERILWRTELPFSVSASFPAPGGILLCGTHYDPNTLAEKLDYYVCYDTAGNLLWEHKEAASGWRNVLAAQTADGQTVFASRCISGSASRLELLAVDGNGALLWKHSADLPADRIVQACCLAGEGTAFLAVQDRSRPDVVSFMMVDRQHSTAQPARHLADLKAPEKDNILIVRSLLMSGTDLFVSAYSCRVPDPETIRHSTREEVDDVLELAIHYCQEKQDPDVPADLLTEPVHDRYTAVLFRYAMPVYSSASFPFKPTVVLTWPAALGSLLNHNDQGEITWDIEEIGDVRFSPATNAFSLYAPCRVLQYFFEPADLDGEHSPDYTPGGILLTDKPALFTR